MDRKGWDEGESYRGTSRKGAKELKNQEKIQKHPPSSILLSNLTNSRVFPSKNKPE